MVMYLQPEQENGLEQPSHQPSWLEHIYEQESTLVASQATQSCGCTSAYPEGT